MDALARHNSEHAWGRRNFLKFAGAAGLGWLTPASQLLAARADKKPSAAQSMILLWLDGAPSQLETWDPHEGARCAGGTKAIQTAIKGIELAKGFEQTAEQMGSISIVRSLVSKEGDHERGTFLMKTGYRPEATVDFPSIGAVVCHELPYGNAEIPRHISIIPTRWPGKGGFLGAEFDAFQTGDPREKLPDVSSQVAAPRDQKRLRDLAVVDQAFARGRSARFKATMHRETTDHARLMMSSEQLKAFEINREPAELVKAYGDHPFGRGCLAARRLVEAGVRCVEVTLSGWDAHVNNHEIHSNLLKILDPAFATLLRDLRERGLLDRTVVLCGGEFGRTPKINLAGGRDHWTNGFSLAVAGAGIVGGRVHGATDPEGAKDPKNPIGVADVHATLLTAVGLDPTKELDSPVGRPIKLSEGKPIREILVG